MSIRWAIFGTGDISAKFVAGLAVVPGASATVVASREQGTAQAFASKHGIAKAVAGYDPAGVVGQADAVYIATPTALHAEHAIACIDAGLHVLVEKPLAANLADAERVIAAARDKKRFAMEGMWTRFLPGAIALRDASTKIDNLHLLTGGFAIANAIIPTRPLFQPGFGGGAMRQYGVYPLAIGQMIAGPAESIHVTGKIGETGVETTAAITVRYKSGAVGNYYASLETTGENGFAVYGATGRASMVGPIYRPTGVRKASFTPRVREGGGGGGTLGKLKASPLGQRLVQIMQHRAGPSGKAVAYPYTGNGYNAEAAEAQRCIAAGLIESPLMTHADSLELVRLVDTAIGQIGVRA